MSLHRMIPLAVVFAFAACDDPTEPSSRYLGYLSLDGNEPIVEVAQVDSTISIEVSTWVLDGCYVRSGEDVVLDDRTITVRPFDRKATDSCHDAIITVVHPVTIDVDEAGTWTVRVEGQDYDSGVKTPAAVEVEIEVVLEGETP